jgi:protein arginine kinase activator
MQNETIVFHLCEACARKKGVSISVADNDEHASMEEEEKYADWVCPECKYTYASLKKTGRLGCPQCYRTFHEKIDELLKEVHGSNKHRGKRYSPKRIEFSEFGKIQQLRTELDKAIQSEEFELAAVIRDTLKNIKISSHQG